MKLHHSPVEQRTIAGLSVFLKRDDLLHPAFSGNKARKFAYFLEHDFAGITRVIGHGSAQANSLYSLAALAQLKGWQLDFYVNHIPAVLRQQPIGNYAAALALGANVLESGDISGEALEPQLAQQAKAADSCLFIPEGGRAEIAAFGVYQLAREIAAWFATQSLTELVVFLPSGTGTTALFLSEYFTTHQLPIEVMTCAVVGDEQYLRKQFSGLCADEAVHPTIVSAPKRYHFGKCYLDFLLTWRDINRSGVTFELLYDPLGWICLHSIAAQLTRPVMYIHQGGLQGNESMLPRYRRKYPTQFGTS